MAKIAQKMAPSKNGPLVQKLGHSLISYKILDTVGGPFLHDFRPFLGARKGQSRISEEKMTKISDFVFFIWVIFLQKREIFAIFLFVLSNFLCF